MTDNLPYEKVGKNEPVCIADEVLFEIPENYEYKSSNSLIFTATSINIVL